MTQRWKLCYISNAKLLENKNDFNVNDISCKFTVKVFIYFGKTMVVCYKEKKLGIWFIKKKKKSDEQIFSGKTDCYRA